MGPTSHDLVGWSRRLLHCRRIGHCGTLDPAASGLLVLAVGIATRAAALLTGADKTYRAEIILGRRTSSGDRDGEILEERAVDRARLPEILEAARGLVGAHELAPPAHSAIKVDGERAYARVRRGEEVILPPRPMVVRRAEAPRLLEVPQAPGLLHLSVDLEVSKGTYIRSLAELLGTRLGLPATLGGLRRLACGALSVDDPRVLRPEAVEMGEGSPYRWRLGLAEAAPEVAPEGALIPLDQALGLPVIECTGSREGFRRLTQGQRVALAELIEGGETGLPSGDPRPGEALVSLVARQPCGALATLVLGLVRGEVGADPALHVQPQRVLQFASEVASNA